MIYPCADILVKRLGYDHKDIADKMQYFRNAGEKGLGEYIEVPPHFAVSVETVRGKLPCPFECQKILPKSIIKVKNKKLDKEIIFTDIMIHLILFHGFYQGKKSLYRVEPEDLIEILEIDKPE